MTTQPLTLTAWNEVQSLATDVIAAYTDNTNYSPSDLRDDWSHVTLPSDDELATAVSATRYAVDALPENEQSHQHGHAVSKWLLDADLILTPEELEDPEAYFFTGWNRTQQIASQLLNRVITEGEGYDAVVDVWPSDNPPEEDRIMGAILDATEHDTNLDKVNELATWLQDYHTGDLPDPEPDVPEKPDDLDVSDDEWRDAVEVAEATMTYFKDHEGTFREVMDEWSDFDFPPRTELTFRIPNIRAETHAEEVAQTAEYLLTWRDQPAPEEVNAYR